LHKKRIRQPEFRHVMGSLRLTELGVALGSEDGDQRVTRENPQHHEYDDRYARNRQRAEGETSDDIAVHGSSAQIPRREMPSGRTIDLATRRPKACAGSVRPA